MQTSSSRRLRTLGAPVLLAAGALLLAGCAAPGGSAPAPGEHHVTLSLGGQTFTFTPTTCVNTDDELSVAGPGVDNDGQAPAFVAMDFSEFNPFPVGTITVYLDSDTAAPGGEHFVAELGSGDDYAMGHMQDGYEIEAFFRTQDGADTGTGTFMLNCA